VAPLIQLDTHVVIWLYLPRLDLMSDLAGRMIGRDALTVSPMVILELTYLKQIGRLSVDGPAIVASLKDQLGLAIDDAPFRAVVGEAHAQQWTRDPFDRLIAVQALVTGAAWVTADATMREHVPNSVW